MKNWFWQFKYYINSRDFLILLFMVNLSGTIYGYYWYKSQLVITKPQFYLFVPDSPTASLFFTIAILGWILGRHFKLMEVLALITMVKYGLWAVVMNVLTLIENGSIGILGWMLVFSHFMMAVEAIFYIPMYRFQLWHIAVGAIWTLHNDVIDYVYGQMPIYSSISKYASHIGYFTFWLSIICIMIAYYAYNKSRHLKIC